jgi:hypothetical protein
LQKQTLNIPRLSLALTTSGYDLLRAAQWLMLLAIVVSLGTAASLWWNAREMDRQAVEYEQATRRVQDANRLFLKDASQAGYDLTEDRIRGLTREVSFANQLLEKGAFSWTRFLNDLEEAVAPHISFSSVKLSFKESVISLTGTALTLKDLTAQIDKLEGHPLFSNVLLSNHQIQEDGEVVKQTVSFTMTVVYHPH